MLLDTFPLTVWRPMYISTRTTSSLGAKFTERMAAIRVADSAGAIHIQPQHHDNDGRIVWRYIIEDHHQILDDATDLRCGTGYHIDPRKAMATLLGFLGAAADAYRHTMNGQGSDNTDLFPPDVNEWAYQHDDEIAALALELDNPHPPARRPRRLRIVRRYFTPDDITDGDISYRDEQADDIDCEPDDDADGDTATTIAAEALRDAGCTQPSATPGPLRPGDWWTDPDGSHTVDHHTGLRCECAALPEGFTTDELNTINDLL